MFESLIFYLSLVIALGIGLRNQRNSARYYPISEAQAVLAPGAPVVVIENNGVARAHADSHLMHPHLAGNADGLGGENVIMTYCAMAIIRNGQLGSQPQQIPRELSRITNRTVDSMIKILAVGDLYRIYSFAQRDDINFFYTHVPEDYVAESTEAFDKADINRLFNIGFELGASGKAWSTKPPGLNRWLPEQ